MIQRSYVPSTSDKIGGIGTMLRYREIRKPWKKYDVSDAERGHRAFYGDMTLPTQIILKLILHKIRPKSHTSSTTTDVTILNYYILSGRLVNVARIIAKELKLWHLVRGLVLDVN